MNQPNQVARLLRERRAKLGLSRPQLAARSGISHETIEKWEQGRRRPSLHDAMRLAHALGIPSYELAAATLNVSGNETGGPEISPQAARSLLETSMLVFDWDIEEAARIAGATADDVDLWLRGEGDLPDSSVRLLAARLGPQLIDVARGEEADDGATVGRARVRRIS
jgi:transcriptional regulator with XRE-family HTH domain